jgi:hypothetical protein
MLTEAPPIASVSFRQAAAALRRRSLPEVTGALESLYRLQVTTTSVQVIREFPADEIPEYPSAANLLSLLEAPNQCLPIEAAAFNALVSAIPLNDWYMEEGLLNLESGEKFEIFILPQGFPWTFDEFYDLIGDADSYPEAPVLMLAKFLDAQVDPEYWKIAIEHYGWPMMPRSVQRSGPKQFNLDRFFGMLDKLSLPEFKVPFQMVWGTTGNPFLDWDYEEASTNSAPYTIESIRALKQIWRDAKPILVEYMLAEQHASPETLEQVIRAWDRCMKYEKPVPRPRTLLEIMTGETTHIDLEDDEPERVIDPFYGPLDGIWDEDEELEEEDE